MSGIRGADLQCYRQSQEARLYGTFRAFLSGPTQDLVSIVKRTDRTLPIVNLKGQLLAKSWSSLFEGQAGATLRGPIYSFNGRNILTDPLCPPLSSDPPFFWDFPHPRFPPPGILAPPANENLRLPKGDGSKKGLSVEHIYQKKTQLEHILLRPDTYIGSVELVTQQMWVFDEGVGLNCRDVTFVPGLYKIFDEILVNAADNKQRDKSMSCIKVTIDVFATCKFSSSQTWTDNMGKAGEMKLKYFDGEDYTCVTFQPDLSKFKMTILDKDIVALMSRRAYDIAGSTKDVKVFLNGQRLPVKGFRSYVDLYLKDKVDETGNALKVIHEEVNSRWEVCLTLSEKGFQQVSFVNSIATTKGGRHVDYVADQLVTKLIDVVKKKNKNGVAVKPFQVKNHMWIFINSLIENPTFDSQTKENMTLQAKNFGSTCKLSEKFIKGAVGCGIVESLGTSTSKEAKEYFADMAKHRIGFKYSGPEDDAAITLAFSKKKVEERKEWLTNFMEDRRQRKLHGLPEVKGLKPGQRKVLFTCFKRNDKREVKVAQLAGSVAEMSSYHHGEASLMMTIINLAQNFVGSNNLNLLQPIGQFGTRLHGGKDSASPRYIFTMLSPLARLLFPAMDDNILRFLYDDNQRVEPEWYMPIIPMVLINGAEGIGTGWSCKIPNFDIREVVNNIRRLMDGEEPLPMIPSYKNFKGTIDELGPNQYVISGEVSILDSTTIEITELPVRTWTQTYKEQVLEPMLNGTEKTPPLITDYKEYHTDTTVKFIVKMTEEKLAEANAAGLHKVFKLQTNLTCNSMVLFDHVGFLKKYDSPQDILKEFFELRLRYYSLRKEWLIGMLSAESAKLSNQARFILEKIDGKIVIENKPKKELIQVLIQRGYESDPVKAWKESQNKEEEEEEEEESEKESAAAKGPDFNYLLNMPLWYLTKEKKDELCKQRDNKEAELENLKRKSPSDLWKEDLAVFVEELDVVEAKQAQDELAGFAGKPLKGVKGGKVKVKKAQLPEVMPSPHGIRVVPRITAEMKAEAEKRSKKKIKSEKNEFDENQEENTSGDKEPSGLKQRLAKKLNAEQGAKRQATLPFKPLKKMKKRNPWSDSGSDSESDFEAPPQRERVVRQAAGEQRPEGKMGPSHGGENPTDYLESSQSLRSTSEIIFNRLIYFIVYKNSIFLPLEQIVTMLCREKQKWATREISHSFYELDQNSSALMFIARVDNLTISNFLSAFFVQFKPKKLLMKTQVKLPQLLLSPCLTGRPGPKNLLQPRRLVPLREFQLNLEKHFKMLVKKCQNIDHQPSILEVLAKKKAAPKPSKAAAAKEGAPDAEAGGAGNKKPGQARGRKVIKRQPSSLDSNSDSDLDFGLKPSKSVAAKKSKLEDNSFSVDCADSPVAAVPRTRPGRLKKPVQYLEESDEDDIF
ncbi:hypothetical protein llap_17771 [Limosa lapponica baueri]|uniref:DNA topoisomerase 2 n=1 Tax=Limosa lapponica baueri TaxID=1758121 RepID=A0A2I0TDR5_LIMLA|nr:hypothetical protein llap_17771 [Limosa lapponica baueri]